MNLPLVSFIVPAYNVQDCIAECLSSVLSQAYLNIECICVDDGSKDETVRIVDEMASKDNRLRVVHQVNQGVSVARNKGLELARGEYIVFVDSDDMLTSNFLTCPLVFLQDNPQVDIWVGQRRVVDEKGRVCSDQPTPIPKCQTSVPISKFLRMDGRFYLYCVWGKVFRRSFISQARLTFLPGVNIGEDGLFMAECYAECRQVVVDDCAMGYVHRKRSGSLVRRDWVAQLDESLMVVEALEKFASKKDMKDSIYSLLAQWAMGKVSVLFHPGYSIQYLRKYCLALCRHPKFKPVVLNVIICYGAWRYASIARILSWLPGRVIAEILFALVCIRSLIR